MENILRKNTVPQKSCRGVRPSSLQEPDQLPKKQQGKHKNAPPKWQLHWIIEKFGLSGRPYRNFSRSPGTEKKGRVVVGIGHGAGNEELQLAGDV